MSDNDWFLVLISELYAKNVGDKGRLESIRDYLKNGKEIYQTDKNYLITKYAELQKLQQSEPVKNIQPKIEPEQALRQDPIQEQSDDKKTDELDKLKEEVRTLNEKVKRFESKEEGRVIEKRISVQEKSLSTTLVLSLVLGLIGIQGTGHMYVNRVGKGVVILIISIILFGAGIATLPGGALLLVIYFIIFIWQIFDSRKCCYEYNTKLRNKMSQET